QSRHDADALEVLAHASEAGGPDDVDVRRALYRVWVSVNPDAAFRAILADEGPADSEIWSHFVHASGSIDDATARAGLRTGRADVRAASACILYLRNAVTEDQAE